MSLIVTSCVWAFLLGVVTCQSLEEKLARTNFDGFPEHILYEALNAIPGSMDKSELAEMFKSKEAQDAAIAAAVEYSSKQLGNSDMRVLEAEANDCSNSWISWLPFNSCTVEKTTEAESLSVLADDHTCYRGAA